MEVGHGIAHFNSSAGEWVVWGVDTSTSQALTCQGWKKFSICNAKWASGDNKQFHTWLVLWRYVWSLVSIGKKLDPFEGQFIFCFCNCCCFLFLDYNFTHYSLPFPSTPYHIPFKSMTLFSTNYCMYSSTCICLYIPKHNL